MDKGAIERFAISARNKLRHSVDLRMTELGANPSHPAKVDVIGNYVVLTDQSNGLETRLTSEEDGARNQLLTAISQNGYDNVVESVAYTWFNRLIAIRYMEVNNYLPTHVRVLSSITPGKREPDLVTQCLSVKLECSDSEKEKISKLQADDDSDGLFKLMFLIQCRELNKILPELFTRTKAYENMLCDLSYTNPDGVVRDLVDNIQEEDFKDAVQIIGWMYQNYNTELKDDTFAKLKKNVKISKERIPSATQLFTPDWIVRYMVENSVGRAWLDGHPDDDLKSKWKYYLDEAPQTPEVEAELSKLRKEKSDMSPEEITVIDPCMGSGHILVYAFDILVQIYESYGYSKEDAAVKIVEKNLYGLDIDDRAYQLAYFAVMMKARQYNSRVFDNPVKNHIFALVESDIITEEVFIGFGNNMSAKDKSKALSEIDYLVRTFRNAKTYGSLIKVRDVDWTLVETFLGDHGPSLSFTTEVSDRLSTIIESAKCLSLRYSAVVTNPPYMGASGMDGCLLAFVKQHYPETKSDLSTCFMEKTFDLAEKTGYVSMINIPVWMFITSYEKLRHNIIEKQTIINMVHPGRGIFGSDFGTTSFVISNISYEKYVGTYCKLYTRQGSVDSIDEKEHMFLSGKYRFYCNQHLFLKIPGAPIAYWTSEQFIENFKKGVPISSISDYTGSQNKTADNVKYLRMWWEVNYSNIGPGKKWVLYSKGGDFRKYYGNLLNVVDWSPEARHFYETNKTSNLLKPQYWFKEGIMYTMLSIKGASFRYMPPVCVFDMGGPAIIDLKENLFYVLGLLNSEIAKTYFNTLNPTINLQTKDVNNLPVLIDSTKKEVVTELVKKCVQIVKKDWDSNEYSINYSLNPMINGFSFIEDAIKSYTNLSNSDKSKLIEYDEEINEIFSGIYHMDIPKPEMDTEPVDLRKEIVKFISYSVGCMFGRYSLNTPGLCYAGGSWDSSKYSSFIPDQDNIIPINDEEYFGDDIMSYFERFVETVLGKETLEENLKYIANVLEIKGSGTAREKIRKYFLNDFYKDHVQMYQKCPIYWLFDSGKANGFKALIYMHRYTPDLIGKMRQNYLLKMQRIYAEQYNKEKDQVRRTAIRKKLDEIERYDLAMELYASKNVSIDLDDGVKHNYALFQDIENSRSAKDKINLLNKI